MHLLARWAALRRRVSFGEQWLLLIAAMNL
jgi:hypothetical protein